MVVPSPYGLAGDAFVASMIASGFLGTLREVHVHSLNNQLADPDDTDGMAADDPILRVQHADFGHRV